LLLIGGNSGVLYEYNMDSANLKRNTMVGFDLKQKKKIAFLLCEDKNTEVLETDIYKLTLELK
jgi:hypothetical protein